MKIEYVPASVLLPEQRVEIEVPDGAWRGLYTSRVHSVAGRDITLEAPIREGIFVPLRPDTPVLVRAASRSGLASFDTRVVERQPGTIPTLVVDRPARLMVVQRRAFYRVTAQIPVLFDRAPAGGLSDLSGARMEAGIVIDLSGGGAALRSPLALKEGEWLRVRLPLEGKGGEMLLAAEVVGINTRRARFDTERVARVRFSGLSQRDENRLFQLIRSLERGRLRERRSLWEGC